MSTVIVGFDKPSFDIKHRLIMSVAALEKCGKTHFSLTAPAPLALLNFDEGLEGVISKFSSRDVAVSNFNLPNYSAVHDFDYLGTWERFKRSYAAALKHPKVRTIVVDTFTEVWELIRLARLGRISAKPQHFGPINAEMRELIKGVYDTDKNLILLHKMRKVYVGKMGSDDSSWNGEYEPAGFKDVPFLVQTNIRLRYDYEEETFTMDVTDCRQNSKLFGRHLSGAMVQFPLLAAMVFPGTSPKDWE